MLAHENKRKKKTLNMAFTNFGKRFFIYIQAVSQCHSCFPFVLFKSPDQSVPFSVSLVTPGDLW